MLEVVSAHTASMTALKMRRVILLKSCVGLDAGIQAGFDAPELPLKVGQSTLGDPHVLCVAPTAWLLTTDTTDTEWHKQLQQRASRHSLATLELTSGLAAFHLVGSAVRDILAKGCGLDLHPAAFPIGACARTRFAQISVTLDC